MIRFFKYQKYNEKVISSRLDTIIVFEVRSLKYCRFSTSSKSLFFHKINFKCENTSKSITTALLLPVFNYYVELQFQYKTTGLKITTLAWNCSAFYFLEVNWKHSPWFGIWFQRCINTNSFWPVICRPVHVQTLNIVYVWKFQVDTK